MLLQEQYIDITSRAAECMKNHVSVQKLCYAVLCLPPNLKKEHKMFVKTAKAEVKEAESIDDIFSWLVITVTISATPY